MADEKSKIPRIFKEMLAGAVDVHLLLYAVPTTVRIGRSPEGRCHKDAEQ